MVSKLADAAKKAVWPSLVFNLSNEPAFKFKLCVFGDKSPDVESRASYYTKNQVIYFETPDERYELFRNQSVYDDMSVLKKEEVDFDLEPSSTYTFSKVIDPWSIDNDFYANPNT